MSEPHPSEACVIWEAADQAHVDQLEAEALDPATTEARREQIVQQLATEGAAYVLAIARVRRGAQ